MGFRVDTLHDLALGGLDQGRDAMVLAAQPHYIALDGLSDELFAHDLQIEAFLDAVGDDVFHVQHAALQGTGRAMQDALVPDHHVIGGAPANIDDRDRHGHTVRIQSDACALSTKVRSPRRSFSRRYASSTSD